MCRYEALISHAETQKGRATLSVARRGCHVVAGGILSIQPRRFAACPAPACQEDRTRSQRSGTRFPYTNMKMELDHEKQDVSLGEIVYVYEYVNEYDYAPPNKAARYPLPTNHWYGLPSCIRYTCIIEAKSILYALICIKRKLFYLLVCQTTVSYT